MRSLSVVLNHPPPDAELVELVTHVLSTWKDKLGLSFISEGTVKDEAGLRVDVWTEEDDPMTEISLIRDDVAGIRYVSVVAADDAVRQRMREQLPRDFQVASLEDLQDDVRRRGETDPASYLRLALGGGEEFDETSFELIREGLGSPHAPVRAQAAMAAGLVHWAQLADDAERALASERDEGIGRLLAVAVQLARHGRL